MKKYYTLDKQINWLDILTSVNPKVYNLLDSNNDNYIFGWGVDSEIVQENYVPNKIDSFLTKSEYAFGYIGYDSKNIYLQSNSVGKNNFLESIFFNPKNVIIKKNNNLLYFGTKEDFDLLQNINKVKTEHKSNSKISVNLISGTSKTDYLKNVNSIKSLIQHGDIYELNYCINFYQDNFNLDLLNTFTNLKNKTKAPFSSIFKYNQYHIISASPERFFNKQFEQLMSQPIKGTAARGKTIKEDEEIKLNLIKDKKEIAENIMIVDLVRNDFSKFSFKNSVRVTELCKLYTFKNVHQLISTIFSNIDKNISFEEIINNIFPMGSMTGAPKSNAIKFINKFENFKRNIYSGSIGFIAPNKNMDFNVVIRTILFNSIINEISIGVGGAITYKSIPEKEYLECLIKLNSISDCIIPK